MHFIEIRQNLLPNVDVYQQRSVNGNVVNTIIIRFNVLLGISKLKRIIHNHQSCQKITTNRSTVNDYMTPYNPSSEGG